MCPRDQIILRHHSCLLHTYVVGTRGRRRRRKRSCFPMLSLQRCQFIFGQHGCPLMSLPAACGIVDSIIDSKLLAPQLVHNLQIMKFFKAECPTGMVYYHRPISLYVYSPKHKAQIIAAKFFEQTLQYLKSDPTIFYWKAQTLIHFRICNFSFLFSTRSPVTKDISHGV